MTYLPWINEETGNRATKILPLRPFQDTLEYFEKLYGKENVFSVPCGHCLECRLQHASEWSVRCYLESLEYETNLFITLTYAYDKKTLSKRDLQLFIKRLRDKFPNIRYFACGEYGETTHRPHYHVLLFNCDSISFTSTGKRSLSGYYFKSPVIENAWSHGLVDIGEVSRESIGYVARYTQKKVDQINVDKDEFIIMSKGIGLSWYEKHKDLLWSYDCIIAPGLKHAKVPRYFYKKMQIEDPVRFEELKKRHVEMANTYAFSNLLDHHLVYREEMYEINDRNLRNRIKTLRRDLL